MSTLQKLFEKHGTDKADHGYAAFYETLLPPARMLEVGVWKGASLRAWREWWPQASIIGMDTFGRDTWGEACGLYALVVGDSRYEKPWCKSVDLLIDDGSHKPRDQAATLRNLWPLLAPGGRYVIEDVLPIDLIGEGNVPEWFRHPSRRNDFTIAAFLTLANEIEATGGKLTRHDFREQSGKPDSVLLEIRKA